MCAKGRCFSCCFSWFHRKNNKMGRKNNSFPLTRGLFFCKWRKRRACTLRALEMMKKGCWRRSSGTLPGFHKNFSPKNAVRCMWLRSTLRWLSQRGASAIAARSVGVRSAMYLTPIPSATLQPSLPPRKFASPDHPPQLASASAEKLSRKGQRRVFTLVKSVHLLHD